MNIKQTICAAVLSTLAFSAVAGEVNESNVTTFAPNTPAMAAEVNATISALITAINDNSSRLDDLEAAASAVTASVSGRTYVFLELEAEVGGNNGGGFSNMLLFGARSNMVFNTDNTGTIDLNGTDHELTTFHDGGLQSLQFDMLNDAATGLETFTWSQTGAVVTLTFVDEGETDNVLLTMSMDGSIGVKAENDSYGTVGPASGFGGSADLGIAVRVQ